MAKKTKGFFLRLGLTGLALILSACSVGTTPPQKDETEKKEESKTEAVYREIELTESLFIADDVPVYQEVVGDFNGMMIGYAGGDGKYGIYGKYEEDFEVEIDKVFTSDMRLEYVFASNQWCVTEFCVCDASDRKLFGIVRDWIAFSQLEFYDVGYVIDYRQNPNTYFAQGNQYSDLYEALCAKHLCTPKYNDGSSVGWVSVEAIGDDYVKISASVDVNATKPLEQIFKFDASKGYKIKICDGRQRTLDYVEESGAPIMREYRTCVMITSLKSKRQ